MIEPAEFVIDESTGGRNSWAEGPYEVRFDERPVGGVVEESTNTGFSWECAVHISGFLVPTWSIGRALSLDGAKAAAEVDGRDPWLVDERELAHIRHLMGERLR
jgi:hypothetical protein